MSTGTNDSTFCQSKIIKTEDFENNKIFQWFYITFNNKHLTQFTSYWLRASKAKILALAHSSAWLTCTAVPIPHKICKTFLEASEYASASIAPHLRRRHMLSMARSHLVYINIPIERKDEKVTAKWIRYKDLTEISGTTKNVVLKVNQQNGLLLP